MGGLLWFIKGGMALIFTLANTLGMTPVWLVRSILIRRRTLVLPDGHQAPKVLQWYLTFSARTFLWWLAALRAQPAPNTRTPGRLRDWLLCRRFAWVEPAPRASFDDSRMPVKLAAHEAKRKTAALWYLSPSQKYVPGQLTASSTAKRRTRPVLLYFHGGAYITLEAGDVFVGLTLARMQARYADVDVFSVNYRLAPGSKHPTQLFEAYSAWRHLRAIGYEHIWIGGDSAGANLALTLWRYLDESSQDGGASAVAGLVLHSPWLDMQGHRRAAFRQSLSTCAITPDYVQWGLKAMQTNGARPAPNSDWICPSAWTAQRIRRLPPVIVTNGGAETLLDEANEFVKKAKAEGVQVEHFIMPHHPHDFGAMFWFYPSIRVMFRHVGKWIGQQQQ